MSRHGNSQGGAPSSPGAAQEQLVAACMAHLNANAERYYNMVSDKDADGILWAVFSCDPHRSTTQVSVKRASFLPLAQVMSTKAQSLIQMYHACNLATQFVCWFTLENGSGEPMVSKVMVVDAPQGQLRQQHRSSGSKPLQNAMAAMQANSSEAAVLQNLKADMLNFQEREEQQLMQQSAPRLDETRSALQRASSSSNAKRGGASPAAGNVGGANGADVRAMTDAASQYQHILRVSLQIADSVSRMGTAMDELTQRVDALEKELNSRPRAPPPELVAALLARIEELERKNAAMEQRVGGFDTFQENIFTQFQQFKDQFRIPTFSSTVQPVASIRDPPLASSSSFRSERKHSALDTPPRSRSPIAGAAGAASQGASESFAVGSAAAGPSGAAPADAFSSSRAHASSPPRTSSAIPSTTSSGGGGGDGGASLSDMIRSMELKLSRIRAPSH